MFTFISVAAFIGVLYLAIRETVGYINDIRRM